MDGDGAVASAGRFSVDDMGMPSPARFHIDADEATAAVSYILTIEPVVGDDPKPSAVHILAGDFVGDDADLDTEHEAALGTGFDTVAGKVLIATPTTTITTDENQGYWFLDNSSGSAMPGLSLPDLPEGWVYEGWAVVDGVVHSTGTFTSVSGADSDGAGPGAGTDAAGPAYQAKTLLTLRLFSPQALLLISVEPVPDNSTDPFSIKPLTGAVAADDTGELVDMSQNLGSLPSGTVSLDRTTVSRTLSDG